MGSDFVEWRGWKRAPTCIGDDDVQVLDSLRLHLLQRLLRVGRRGVFDRDQEELGAIGNRERLQLLNAFGRSGSFANTADDGMLRPRKICFGEAIPYP